MQKSTVVLLLVTLFSCGESKNQLMTKLINDKKMLEDSANACRYYESEFTKKAKAAMRNNPDTNQWKRLADSSSKYFGLGHSAREQIAAIDFSIDSLSKMK